MSETNSNPSRDTVAAWQREQAELAEYSAFRDDAGWRWQEPLEAVGPAGLAESAKPVEFLVQGVLAKGMHGPFGGKEKSLKTYSLELCQVALASGKPAFGYDGWAVPEAKPVLMFVGEGGKEELRRRLQRIALEVYGIPDISVLPIYAVVGAAEMNSETLLFKLWQQVGEIRANHGEPPAWINLDSLYNYHDADVEVQNLYARGPMLRRFQGAVQYLCGDDTCLSLVDHFRKSASDSTALEEYMQSGMGAWAGTWWNAAHREEPDTTENLFRLNVTIGSRASYGGSYEVDIDLGPFNEAARCHERTMRVRVRRVRQHEKKRGRAAASKDEIVAAVYKLVESAESQYTKTQVRDMVKEQTGAGTSRVAAILDNLIRDRQLKEIPERRDEDGRSVTRPILRPYGKLRIAPTRPTNPTHDD